MMAAYTGVERAGHARMTRCRSGPLGAVGAQTAPDFAAIFSEKAVSPVVSWGSSSPFASTHVSCCAARSYPIACRKSAVPSTVFGGLLLRSS
jgi:hypothetical protein